jgi:Xaa-Pro aminopeptidase
MRYSAIPSRLFIENRRRFARKLLPNSAAIFTSNDILPSNADGSLKFLQNRDLFYLSGVDQEESLLVIFPDAFQGEYREMLFLKETNETIARWEGEKLSKEQARKVSGIDTIFWLTDWDRILKDVMSQAQHVYLNLNEHLRRSIETETRELRLARELMHAFPLHRYERSAPIMHALRAVKSEQEIDLMRQAARINTDAYLRVLQTLKPGIKEYELEAEFIHEYTRQGSSGFSYEPIIASGPNACVLHYIENTSTVENGHLVLFDVGCWYANYASDVTRCFPANGRFTPRQKEVYNSVLRVKKAAMAMLRPGNQLQEYQREVGKIMEAELLQLGLITTTDIQHQNPAWPAYKKYFMHGTSHYLGLDVHDVGLWTTNMEAGNVFTVEPGIYIPEEGIGIRIEDNVVITEDGLINLTEGIPQEVDAIEDLMNR